MQTAFNFSDIFGWLMFGAAGAAAVVFIVMGVRAFILGGEGPRLFWVGPRQPARLVGVEGVLFGVWVGARWIVTLQFILRHGIHAWL